MDNRNYTAKRFKKVKPAKARVSGLVRGVLMMLGMIIAAGIAVFAFDNNQDTYEINHGIEYVYEYGIGYDYSRYYHGLGDEGFQAPVYDEYYYIHGYDSYPQYETGSDYYHYADGLYASGYAANEAPAYITIAPASSLISGTYTAGVEFPIAGVPADGVITTNAQLRAAINAEIHSDFPHGTGVGQYTRIINIGNIGANNILDITATGDIGATNTGNSPDTVGTIQISNGRHIWIRTCPDLVEARLLANPTGNPRSSIRRTGTSAAAGRQWHFRITSHARLTISDIELFSESGRTSPGGGVWVWNNGTFVMEDGAVIRNNGSVDLGTAAAEGRAALLGLVGSAVQREGANSSRHNGGGVLVHHNLDSHNAQGEPTGVHATFIMNGGEIHSNGTHNTGSTGGNGAGVAVQGRGSRFYLRGGVIGREHNVSPLTPAIPTGHTDALALTFVNAAIALLPNGNVARHSGGGVAVLHGATFIMNDIVVGTTIDGETGASVPAPGIIAGNIGRYGSPHFNPVNAFTTTWGAAGVYVRGLHSTVYMHTGAIRGNFAARNGGGVAVRDYPVGRTDNGPTFHFFGGRIENNLSAGNVASGAGGGGGVALSMNSHFNMHDGAYIHNNVANTSGGGVRIRDGGTFTMYGGTISNNTATRAGATGTNTGGGGGVMMEDMTHDPYNAVEFTMHSGRIINNTSINNRAAVGISGGAGIFVRGGSLNLVGAGEKIIEGNVSNAHGGGIMWIYTGDMDIAGNTGRVSVSGNSANLDGGGLCITGNGFVADSHFHVNGNTAGRHGGGIFSNDLLTLRGATVSRLYNPSTSDYYGNSALHGGGVFVSGGTLTATYCNILNVRPHIQGNTATANGGGVHVSAGMININGAYILDNTAEDGGGIFASGGTVNLAYHYAPRVYSRVVNNTATRSGGGIFLGRGAGTDAATINMRGEETTVSNNKAQGDYILVDARTVLQGGGGVFVQGAIGTGATSFLVGNAFNMYNGVIYNNEAIRGGGVFVSGGTRTGHGAGHSAGGTFTMLSGEIRYNRAISGPGANPGGDGGGVYMDGGTRYQISNTTVGAGQGRASNFVMSGGIIDDNRAVRNGGGVFLDRGWGNSGTPAAFRGAGADLAFGSLFTMNAAFDDYGVMQSYGVIQNNIAGNYGGGVFLHGTATHNDHPMNPDTVSRFNMNVGRIYNNEALYGAGVYVGGGSRDGASTTAGAAGDRAALGGRFTLVSGSINGNHAINDGGGVFMGGGFREGTGNGGFADGGIFNLEGGTINGNTARSGAGIFAGGAVDHTASGSSTRHARGATINITGGRIQHNAAREDGGGMYLSGNILPPTNTTLATAIRFNLNFQDPDDADGAIAHNTARRGGGVFVGGGHRTAGSGTGNGISRGAELLVTGNGTIGPGNTATYYGGGVYVAGGIRNGGINGGATGGTLRFGGNGTVRGNTAGRYGGGVYLRPGRDLVTGAANPDNYPGSSLTMRGGRVMDNTAGIDGGGLWIPNNFGDYEIPPSFSDVVHTLPAANTPLTNALRTNPLHRHNLTDVTISGNTATAGFGGGIWLGYGLSITLNYSRVISNRAGLDGGSLFLHAGNESRDVHERGASILTMRGGYLSGIADRDGGGVFIQGASGAAEGARLIMENSTFLAAVPAAGAPEVPLGRLPVIGLPQGSNLPRGAADHGGGIYLQGGITLANAGVLEMRTGSIGAVDTDGIRRGSIARYDGGGLFIATDTTPGRFLFEGTVPRSIAGNDAARGGGVFISEDINLTLPQTMSITNNRGNFGGGIWLDTSSELTMSPNSSLNFNHAYYDGGGAFLAANTELVMAASGDIRGNRATFGGGVYVSDGRSASHSTAFTGSGGVFTMHGGYIRDNIAGTSTVPGDGGGVWVANYAYFNIAAPIAFNNNSAVGTIENNEPIGGMGGAIFTARHEYFDPLQRVLPGWSGPEMPANRLAYSNIIFTGVASFTGNTAVFHHMPPVNATAAIPATVFTSTSQDENEHNIILHPLNNNDINFMHIPDAVFYFFSTNELLYRVGNPEIIPVSGTQFILFRTRYMHVTDAQLDADPNGWHVRFNASGESTSALWVEVPFVGGSYIATSSSNPMAFNFDGRYRYQLVQISAIQGFSVPMGQWHIRYNPLALATENPFVVTVIGPATPYGFASTDTWFPSTAVHPASIDEPAHYVWYFGHMLEMALPLTGGLGSTMLFMLGGVMLAGAVVAVLLIKNKAPVPQSEPY